MWHLVLCQQLHPDNECQGGLHQHPIKCSTPLFDNRMFVIIIELFNTGSRGADPTVVSYNASCHIPGLYYICIASWHFGKELYLDLRWLFIL
jgi:hypothetical protein